MMAVGMVVGSIHSSHKQDHFSNQKFIESLPSISCGYTVFSREMFKPSHSSKKDCDVSGFVENHQDGRVLNKNWLTDYGLLLSSHGLISDGCVNQNKSTSENEKCLFSLLFLRDYQFVEVSRQEWLDQFDSLLKKLQYDTAIAVMGNDYYGVHEYTWTSS